MLQGERDVVIGIMHGHRNTLSMQCRSGAGPAVAVRGVQLEVDLALTQDGARTLASGRADTPSKDNRNLYLVIHPPKFLFPV